MAHQDNALIPKVSAFNFVLTLYNTFARCPALHLTRTHTTVDPNAGYDLCVWSERQSSWIGRSAVSSVPLVKSVVCNVGHSMTRLVVMRLDFDDGEPVGNIGETGS